MALSCNARPTPMPWLAGQYSDVYSREMNAAHKKTRAGGLPSFFRHTVWGGHGGGPGHCRPVSGQRDGPSEGTHGELAPCACPRQG